MIIFMYFTVGFIYDILVTFYYIQIVKEKWIKTGIMSFIITVIQILILYQLITGIDIIENAISYSFGCGIGSACMVYWNKKC